MNCIFRLRGATFRDSWDVWVWENFLEIEDAESSRTFGSDKKNRSSVLGIALCDQVAWTPFHKIWERVPPYTIQALAESHGSGLCIEEVARILGRRTAYSTSRRRSINQGWNFFYNQGHAKSMNFQGESSRNWWTSRVPYCNSLFPVSSPCIFLWLIHGGIPSHREVELNGRNEEEESSEGYYCGDSMQRSQL